MVTKTKSELYSNVLYYETATIDTAATALSSGINLNGLLLVGLTKADIDWDTANMTFQVSHDGATYVDLYTSAGLEKTVTVSIDTDAQYFSLDPSDFAGVKYIKIRSGTQATPVQQTESQDIIVHHRPADQSKN